MLFRFSLYGFLKNQTYFEPFIVLFFLEQGLHFFEIGIAMGVGAAVSNMMEIPTGALADLYGRRRCMIASFVIYILSFLVLATGTQYWQLLCGVAMCGGADAFRGGIHKAMILDWLRAQGRENERTRIYGYTRSWSKIGSAVSVLIGAGLVFATSNYRMIIYFAIIPYVLNLINLATYPAYLDTVPKQKVSLRAVAWHMWQVARESLHHPALRQLTAETMGFQGVYEAVKDYLQPVLKMTALSLPLFLSFGDKQRSALLIGLVYFFLHLLASASSRNAHRVSRWFGGDERASLRVWQFVALAYIVLLPALYCQASWIVIPIFVLLACAQNIWRPMVISRFDAHSDPSIGATLLSIESQAASLATLILAPLLGWLIDLATFLEASTTERSFWPIAIIGAIPAILFSIRRQTLPTAVSKQGSE
ncbi:MFS transporter [Schlesneria paludicola]|uniref:MFS transporter n=1 Tax=Schlesneria paludicola TaxID=360056 RepID=UPI0012FBFA67|nr:MFS transporter [Schlesneria paludicola]